MSDLSPMISDTDMFELDYSWNAKDLVHLCDLARNVYAERKTLRKNDVKIHSSTHDCIIWSLIFASVAAVIIGIGALAGDVGAGLAIAKYIIVIALLCIALAVFNVVNNRKAAKRCNGNTAGKMTFFADGIKDEADGATHAYAWEKLDMCVVTEKVIVFIFKDAGLFLFIPSTDESKQTVIAAFRRFGYFDEVYMRSVK